jgi:hypothetical protein
MTPYEPQDDSDDLNENELEMYRQQVEEEFFAAAERGESLLLYLYTPSLFLTERMKDRLDELLLEEAYHNLFVVQTENWTIYDDGYVVTVISDDNYRKELFEKMIEHFTSKEEYEKCAIAQKELNNFNPQ